METWEAQGLNILFITLLLDDPNEGPPTVVGAQTWKDQFGAVKSAVFPDPSFTFVPGNSVGTPQLSVINPRTMVVEHLHEGFKQTGQYDELEAVAWENKNLWDEQWPSGSKLTPAVQRRSRRPSASSGAWF